MNEDFYFIEILIKDFLYDPVDESAFAVSLQVNGPGDQVQYLRVSFTDSFIEEFFKIPWNKDLAAEIQKMEKEKRDLFVKWAICRVEQWLKEGRKEPNLKIDAGSGTEWAWNIEHGKIPVLSQKKEAHKYIFAIRKTK